MLIYIPEGVKVREVKKNNNSGYYYGKLQTTANPFWCFDSDIDTLRMKDIIWNEFPQPRDASVLVELDKIHWFVRLYVTPDPDLIGFLVHKDDCIYPEPSKANQT